MKTHSETRLDFSKYDAHKKQRTFLCFTLFFMILRRNHVSQVPKKWRISVLIYAKMIPFFYVERTRNVRLGGSVRNLHTFVPHYVNFYNSRQIHSALQYRTLDEVYFGTCNRQTIGI